MIFCHFIISNYPYIIVCFFTRLRDRPFNLKGGYGFLFRSEFFFPTTQDLEYFFFCRAKREFFFQNLTFGYMTKTLNQIFFFLHQNQNIFFSNIGNQNIFLEKNHTPLQVKWSFPKASPCSMCSRSMKLYQCISPQHIRILHLYWFVQV